MNPLDNKHFIDLAMKAITRQSTEQEQAELAELLERQPELRAEFEQLRADADILREVAPLVEATEATSGELPAYARGRLQQHVRQKIGITPPSASEESAEVPVSARRAWWRWAVGFAGVAMVMGFAISALRHGGFLLSWLDLEDPSSQNINDNSPFGLPQFEFGAAFINNSPVTPEVEKRELQDIKMIFNSSARSFPSMEDPGLKAWKADLPMSRARTVVKLIYDRAGENVQVIGWYNGKSFEGSFKVKDHDPHAAFSDAQKFIYQKLILLRAN